MISPDIYSTLRAQVDRISRGGGDMERAMDTARQYLELERQRRITASSSQGNSRLHVLPIGSKNRLKLVHSRQHIVGA